MGVLPFFFNELPKCALTQLALLFLVVIGFHGVLGQSLGLIPARTSEQGNVIGLVSVYNIYTVYILYTRKMVPIMGRANS